MTMKLSTEEEASRTARLAIRLRFLFCLVFFDLFGWSSAQRRRERQRDGHKELYKEMGVRSTLVLRQLKQAIDKVKFLLSTNLSQWLYIGSSASASRRLSFRNQPGLLDIVSDASSEAAYENVTASSLGLSRAVISVPGILSRTITSLWEEIAGSPSMARSANSASWSGAANAVVDIDNRADAFIANLWWHIQMERQVSLELRCYRSNSLDNSSSD